MFNLSSAMTAYFPDRKGGIATAQQLSSSLFTSPFTVEARVKCDAYFDIVGIVDASRYGENTSGWFLGMIHDRLAFGIATEEIYMVTTRRGNKRRQGFKGIGIGPPQIIPIPRVKQEFSILKSNRTLALNQWYHVAAVYAVGGIVLYLNGQPVGEMGLPPGSVRLKDTPLLMGAMWREGADSLCGALAEVRLWQGARSPEAIQHTMSQRLTGRETNLLAYFPLDEGTDTVVWDYAEKQITRHARMNGTTTWLQSTDLPLIDEAERFNPRPDVTLNPVLDFDGQQDYVHLDAPIADIRTVCAWVKPTSPKAGTLISYTGSETRMMLTYRSDGRLVYDENGQTLVSRGNLKRGMWTHVALVMDGSQRRLLLNGADDASGDNFSTAHDARELAFGATLSSGTVSDYFKGQIDALSAWDIARSTDEINAVMSHRLTGDEPGLIGYWNFNEGSGTVASDQSPSRISATIHSAAWVNVADLVLKKARAVTPVSGPDEDRATDEESSVALDAFANSDYPIAVLYRALRDAIKGKKLRLDGELIGDVINVGFLDDILPVFVEIRDVEIKLVEADPGTVGIPGQDLGADGEFVSPAKARVIVTGTTNYMEIEDVDVQITFLTSKGQPHASFQFSLTPESGDETPRWGLGNIFPDIPFVQALNVKGPTIVLTTASTLYDPNFDSTVNEGFNFFGNVDVQGTNNEMLEFIGQFFQVQEMAIHAAMSTGQNGSLVYTLEMAYHRDMTLFAYDHFRLSLSRSDISVEIKGAPPEPKITISNDMVVRFKEFGEYTYLIWTGGIGLEAESISPFFTLNGTGRNPAGELTGKEPNTTVWREPFGIPGVEVRQASLQLGMTYAPPWIDNVGVMGNMKIGDVDGSMAVLVDSNDPDNFVFAGESDELTMLQIVSAMSPATFITYQALPAGLKKSLNNIVDIKIKQPKVYIVPQPTSIGGVHYRDAGVTISGQLSMWGWGASLKIVVDYSNGITVYGTMDQINILGGVFQVTGARGEPNPELDLELSTVRQYARVSARVVLLGISRELYIEASESGFEFDLQDNIPGILKTRLHCVYYEGYLAADGTLNFNLNLNTGPIKIAGVTVVNNLRLVDVGLNASASLRVTDAPSFRLTLNGNFRFYGSTLTMPTLDLRATPDDFRAVHTLVTDHIIDRATDIFKTLFESAREWAQAVADGIIEFAGNAAEVIKEVFNESVQAAAKILGIITSDVKAIARDLQAAYKSGMQTVAKVLRNAGHAARKVSQALEATYRKGLRAVTKALRSAGYAAEEVGDAIKDTFNAGVNEAARALKDAGYAIEDIGKALEGTFTNSARDVAKALRSAGYGAEEVARAIEGAFSDSAREVAKVLRQAGYGINEVGKAIDSVFNTSARGVAEALKYAGYGVNEVGYFLKDVGRFGEDTINSALKGAGYAAREVDKFMGDVFDWFSDAGETIEDAAEDVGEWIKSW